MPRSPEHVENRLSMSVGGSVLFSKDHPELNREFFGGLIGFLDSQIAQNRSVVMIIGGGILARIRQEDAKHFGVTDQKVLDFIGLRVTQHNAYYIQDILEARGEPVKKYAFETRLRPGWIYVRGGKGLGHTSDYVAVKAAIQTKAHYVYNVSTNPGIYAFTETGYDKTNMLHEITYDDYLSHIGPHMPGENIPFDRESTLLAKEKNLTVIFVGSDLSNLDKCIKGEEFIGTKMCN